MWIDISLVLFVAAIQAVATFAYLTVRLVSAFLGRE